MFWYYLARISPGASNLIVALLVGGVLSLEDYGRFSLFQILYMGFAAFSYGWVVQSIARFSNGTDDYLSSSPFVFLRAGFFVSTVAILVGALTALVVNSKLYSLLVLACLLLQGWHALFLAVYQARFKGAQYACSEILRAFLILSFMSLVIYFDGGLFWYLYAIILANLVVVVFDVFLMRVIFNGSIFTVCGTSVKVIFRYGWLVSMWLGFFMIWPAMERALVGYMAGPKLLGEYSLNYDLVFRSFVFLMLPLTLYSQPKIFKLYSDGDVGGVKRLICKVVIFQVLLGIGFALIYALSLDILSLYFTVFERVDWGFFALFSAAAILWQIALVMHKPFECRGDVYVMFYALLCSIFFVSVPLSIGFYARFGIYIFPAALVLSGFFYCFVSYHFGYRKLTDGVR